MTESEMDACVLAPMLRNEIHYRLLVPPLGQVLKRLLRHDGHASAIMRIIASYVATFAPR